MGHLIKISKGMLVIKTRCDLDSRPSGNKFLNI